MNKLHEMSLQLSAAARESANFIANASSGKKNAILATLASKLKKNTKSILAANKKDLEAGKKAGLSGAMLDRLKIDIKRLDNIIHGVEQVAVLTDPVGEIIDGSILPNGLKLSRVRVPLGVAMIIFESRPNVTIDAAVLCLKSGNAAILRGGKEAINTNLALGRCISFALKKEGLPAETIQVVKTTDRDLVQELLKHDHFIDVVIPRGGKGLVKAVTKDSCIPVIKHLDGICHIYVDGDADLDMARNIILNAKTQRPGVCNAAETLLVHKDIANDFLPQAVKELENAGVEIRGDKNVIKILKRKKIKEATREDWATEYLDLILSIGIVNDISQAISHINNFGSHHSDAIVTKNIYAANQFKQEVNSSSVFVNASTRFADGYEYGLGAEIGISTDKIHARGPVGLTGLTTYKWLVEGEGQVRK